MYLLWPLQWGRDHVIAELWRVYRPLGGIYPLQWGRDHVIAEFCSQATDTSSAGSSFNGAAIT